MQDFIERRFYWRKYDARRILERFAATARDETYIERLSAALVGAIRDRLQPQTMGLWLRKPDERNEQVDFIGEIL